MFDTESSLFTMSLLFVFFFWVLRMEKVCLPFVCRRVEREPLRCEIKPFARHEGNLVSDGLRKKMGHIIVSTKERVEQRVEALLRTAPMPSQDTLRFRWCCFESLKQFPPPGRLCFCVRVRDCVAYIYPTPLPSPHNPSPSPRTFWFGGAVLYHCSQNHSENGVLRLHEFSFTEGHKAVHYLYVCVFFPAKRKPPLFLSLYPFLSCALLQ